MWIRGDELTLPQQAHVLSAFVYRWTYENARERYCGRCPACVQYEAGNETRLIHKRAMHEIHSHLLLRDSACLAKRTFRFIKDGSRLSLRANVEFVTPPYISIRGWPIPLAEQACHVEELVDTSPTVSRVRYAIVSAYIHNQTKEAWRTMVRSIALLQKASRRSGQQASESEEDLNAKVDRETGGNAAGAFGGPGAVCAVE